MKGLFKYKELAIYVGVFIAGIVVFIIHNSTPDESLDLWSWWGAFDTASAVALAVLAFMTYLEYQKNEDEIKIIFDVEGDRKDTGLSLLRKEFNRAELKGILGMIRKNQKKPYEIEYEKNIKKFLKDIQDIQKGKTDEFIIKLTKDELEQFDLSYLNT